MKKIISLLLAVTMSMSLCTSAFAAEQATSSASQMTSELISHDELPEEYADIISPNATIYKNVDGSYDIFQETPVLNTNVSPASARTANRYAPKGGSYTDLENGWLSRITCVVYQTYLPRDNVDTWISDHNDGMSDYIKGLVLSLGLTQADKIIAKVLTKYGISMSLSAISSVAEGIIFTLDWMNYKQVISASNSGKNGILIEYLTTIGAGNARVYSQWSSSYVPTYPYDGNATWHAGDYYVMP